MTTPVLAHGIDVVDINDFERVVLLAEGSKLGRYFTDSEIKDSESGGIRIQKLSGRMATKEAVLKSLGVGWGDGISFADVETVCDELGAPSVRLHRKPLAIAEQQGIKKWLVSISHTGSLAIASVIGVGAD